MKKSKTSSLAKLLFVLILSLVAVFAVTSCSCDSETDCTEHSWDAGKVQKEATCEAKGEKLFTCTVCGETKTEEYAGEHTFEEEILTEATCQTAGTKAQTCSVCGFQTTSTIDKLSHNYVKETVEATCTRDGATTYTCSNCGDSYSDVSVRAKGHSTAGCTWTSEEVQESGCNWMHIETATCKSCNEEVEHISYYTKHDFEVEITTAATCVTEGIKTKTCKSCDETETEEFTDANAHTWDSGSASATNASILNYACTNGECTATKSVFSAKEQTSASVPAQALQSAGSVELSNATVKLDQSVLDQLGDSDVTISAETVGNSDISDIIDKLSAEEQEKLNSTTVFDFTLSQGESAISSFNGTVTVTVPYTLEEGADPDNIAVWYIKEDGTLDAIAATYTVVGGQGYAIFETNHFSYYSVVRMSVEERCAVYGHTNIKEVVAPSCNKEGYTLEYCKYCKKMEPRKDFTAALTHNYKASVVDPTCNSMGYTLNKCELCKDTYNSSYVDALTHQYKETVVDPTCKSIGYTLNTCTLCGYYYTSNEKSIVDHSYKDGKCTMCGKASESASNPMLTMIDSLSNASSFYLNIESLTVKGTAGGASVEYIINGTKAYVTLTKDGYLEGEGIANATVSYTEPGEDTYKMATLSKIVFKDKNVYMYTNSGDSSFNSSMDYAESYPSIGDCGPIYESTSSTSIRYPEDVTSDLYAVISQDSFIDMITDEMGLDGLEDTWYAKISEKLLTIWQSMLDTKDSAIEDALTRFVNLIFDKKEENGGYTYTLNPTFTKVLFDEAKTKKLDAFVDKILGKGAYSDIIDLLNRAYEMTVGDLVKEVEAELSSYGITPSVIYEIIEMATGSDIDQTLTEEMKSATVGSLLGEEMTLESYKKTISDLDTMMKENTIMGLLESTYGEYPENDPIGTALDEVIAMLDKATFKFNTTKDGVFIGSSVSFNQFALKEELYGESVDLIINGNISFSINSTYTYSDSSELLEVTDQIKEAILPQKNVYADGFSIFVKDGVVYYWDNSNSGNYYYYSNTGFIPSGEAVATETVNGIECQKYEASIYNLYVINTDSFVYGAHSCEGWLNIGCEADFYSLEKMDIDNLLSGYVWVDAENNVIDIEVTSDLEELDSDSRSIGFYYAPEAKEYTSEPSHNFVLAEDVRPSGCEYGKRLFRCSICGATETTTYGKGHSWENSASLNKGSASCEDGATITTTCSVCGLVQGSYETNYHQTVKKKVTIPGTTECGDIILVYYECACGKVSDCRGTISDHVINDVDWSYDDTTEKNWQTYTCSVCGFSYRFSYNWVYEYLPADEDGNTCWETRTETVIIGDKTYNFKSESNPSHDTEWRENGEYEEWYCVLCGKTITREKFDQYGRTVYYHNFVQDYGYETVYTGCNYVRTYTDGDTETGTQHVRVSNGNIKESCSQYGTYVEYCYVCNMEMGTRYESPYDRWYWNGNNAHDWQYNGECYYCSYCGTESSYGAEGLITLEDMTDSGEFKIGFFNGLQYNMSTEVSTNIIFNYTEDGEGTELENSETYFEIVDTTPYDYEKYENRNSGIITINMDMLNEAIEAQGNVETVSLVFWVLTDSQTQTDENGDPVQFWLAHAITFTLDELAKLN